MKPRRLVLLVTVGSLLGIACARPGTAPPPPPSPIGTEAPAPPPEYASTYRALSASLDAWERTLATKQATSAPVFGAHVLVANGDRGTDVLSPSVMPLVDAELDRLKELGVRGATVTISFPLLNADQPRAADIASFYETVAAHVRARGMTFTVEQHIAFSGTVFSDVQFDFSSLPFDRFVELDRAMAQTIIDRTHPDHLSVLSEPDTFVRLTGYKQAGTPAGAAAMVERIIGGLRRGSTKVGAGVGAWLPNSKEYAAAMAGISTDYVSLHMYPLTDATARLAQAVADAAKARGKPLVIDEAWIYKMGPGEPAAADFEQTTEYFRRDLFSFWAPIDARFLRLVAEFARQNDVAYVAPFWTTYFWSYVDHSPSTKDLSYPKLAQLANQGVMKALRDGTYTSTGRAYGAVASR